MWYALQKESADSWDIGTYDYDKAVAMLKEQGYGLIAVINEETNYCEQEIKYSDLF